MKGRVYALVRRLREKLTENPALTIRAAVTALVLVLAISACIFHVEKAELKNAYTTARDSLGEQLYANLYTVYSDYYAAVEGGSTLDKELSSMQTAFAAACTLDDAMAAGYGEDYRVLSYSARSSLTNAFEAYTRAETMGKSTADAESGMAACINSLESILVTRFSKTGAVIPEK